MINNVIFVINNCICNINNIIEMVHKNLCKYMMHWKPLPSYRLWLHYKNFQLKKKYQICFLTLALHYTHHHSDRI